MYLNEKKEYYIENGYYTYGLECLNCGMVTRHQVGNQDISHEEFVNTISMFKDDDEFTRCIGCGLITRHRFIALSPKEIVTK